MAKLMAPSLLPPVRAAMEHGDAFAITANLKECIIAAHQCIGAADDGWPRPETADHGKRAPASLHGDVLAAA